MTLQELLKSQGLSEEQINGILGAMKDNKIFTASEENLDTRYGKLKKDHDSLTFQYGEATKLIEELKKSNTGNEDLQNKVSTYETQITTLKQENEELKIESSLRFALKDAGAVDVDYLVFKAKEKGEIKLDDDGKVKGIDSIVEGLKTQIPGQFETKKQNKVEERRLPSRDEGNGEITKEEFFKKPYNERVQFKNDFPEQFAKLTE